MDKGPKYLSLTKIQVIGCHWPCPAKLQDGRHFLVIYTAYITQINVKYHSGCVELEVESYKWLMQLCEGLDKQEESTDIDDVIISLYRYVPDYIVGLVQSKRLKKNSTLGCIFYFTNPLHKHPVFCQALKSTLNFHHLLRVYYYSLIFMVLNSLKQLTCDFKSIEQMYLEILCHCSICTYKNTLESCLLQLPDVLLS